MTTGRLSPLMQHLHRLFGRSTDPRSDGQLLEGFLVRRDESAFTALVQRHGPMVYGVCRRLLGNEHDAEDAFQAAFLVLARRAASVRQHSSLGGWLHEVTYHIALRAKSAALRRQAIERQAPPMTPSDPVSELVRRELRPILDEELRSLPEKYREPLILCYLESQTHEEAARRLGWPIGSMSRRLSRGRELLRTQLLRRGITLSAGGLAAAVAEETAAASMPSTLIASAVRMVMRASVEGVPASVMTLAQGKMQEMMGSKLRMALLFLLAAIGVGTGAVAYQTRDRQATEEQPTPTAKSGETRPRTDWFGDPLPPGALARLGTSRLRHNSASVIFSSDGKELISAGEDGMLRFWDPASGKEKRRLRVQSADGTGRPSAFAADGKSVAGTSSQYIHVWDTATGKELRHFPLENGCWRLRLSPDGKKLAAILSRNGIVNAYIQLWDVSAGKKPSILKALAYHNELAFSPDGQLLAVSDQRNGLNLWDTATGKEVRHVADVRGGLVFLPDGKRAAAVTQAGDVKAWNLADGKECWHIKLAPGLHPIAPSFSADFTKMAIGIYDQEQQGKGQIWDIAAGKQICTIPVWNASLRLSPDGKIAASEGDGFNPAMHLWDAATGKEIGPRAGHDSAASLAIAPDGSTIATFGTHKVYLWDAATGRPLLQLPTHHLNSPGMFSPDSRYLVTGDYGKNVLHVWDRNTGKEARRFLPGSADAKGKTEWATPLAFSSDGERLLSWGSSAELIVWDFATGKQLGRRSEVNTNRKVYFSPDARRLARGWGNPEVLIEDALTGKEILTIRVGYEPVAFSPDGEILAVSNCTPKPREGKINVIDLMELASGKRLLRIDAGPDGFNHLGYSPDGRTLATVDCNRFRIWDAVTGKELFRRELPVKYCGRVGYSFCHALAFLPSGDRLATALADSTTLIWDLQPQSWHAGIAVKNLERRDLERLWSDLAAEDAAQAHRAVWTLAAVPDKAVPFLKDHLRPAPALDAKLVRRLIGDLDSHEFAVRQQANKQLAAFGEQIEPALRLALANKPSLEARRRLEWLHTDAATAERGAVRSAERLRVLRAIRALEQIGDRDARQLLRMLAGGDPAARQTRHALQALPRLQQRAGIPAQPSTDSRIHSCTPARQMRKKNTKLLS